MSHGWSRTENADHGCGMNVLHHDHTTVDARSPRLHIFHGIVASLLSGLRISRENNVIKVRLKQAKKERIDELICYSINTVQMSQSRSTNT